MELSHFYNDHRFSSHYQVFNQTVLPTRCFNITTQIFLRISSLFRFKDRLPSLICSSVIYRYRCPGCHASYYGKTTRNLVVRCRDYLGINKAGQKIKSSPSAVGDQVWPRCVP